MLYTFLSSLKPLERPKSSKNYEVCLWKAWYNVCWLFSWQKRSTRRQREHQYHQWCTSIKNKADYWSFPGLACYYRRIIKYFAGISVAFHLITYDNLNFNWTGEMKEEFGEQKSWSQIPVCADFHRLRCTVHRGKGFLRSHLRSITCS